MLADFRGSFPPASEREARMDDPTLWCENDTGNETCLPGLLVPSRSPILFPAGTLNTVHRFSVPTADKFRS